MAEQNEQTCSKCGALLWDHKLYGNAVGEVRVHVEGTVECLTRQLDAEKVTSDQLRCVFRLTKQELDAAKRTNADLRRIAYDEDGKSWQDRSTEEICRAEKFAKQYHELRLHVHIYPVAILAAREAARACGYALAVHGSERRDLDLIAVPWVKEACHPDELLRSIMLAVDAPEQNTKPAEMPNGRIAHTIVFPGGSYIDLAIMPRAEICP